MIIIIIISYRVACNNIKLCDLPIAFLHLLTIHQSYAFRSLIRVTITISFTIVNTLLAILYLHYDFTPFETAIIKYTNFQNHITNQPDNETSSF
jgi:hypothetical protein